MTKTVALLLDQPANRYQQLLTREAQARAAQLDIAVLAPQYAGGSSFVQMDQLLACAKDEQRPDAVMVVIAGAESQFPACRRAAKAGVSLVFLNRLPTFLGELRKAYPEVLVTLVAPDQTEIGRIQAAQCARLVSPGAFVLLVTGPLDNHSAVARRDGFLERTSSRVNVHVLEAHWTEESAFKSVSDWFKLGADRDREVALVACENDPMGHGARRALLQRAKVTGSAAWTRIPVLGCDGVPDEGQQMVRDGELSATVVMPATTPAAIDALHAYWSRGERADAVFLPPQSFPVIDEIGAA
jgi:ABC-type sugar transport system substrate-binding protein